MIRWLHGWNGQQDNEQGQARPVDRRRHAN
jgi:hypothetical protein